MTHQEITKGLSNVGVLVTPYKAFDGFIPFHIHPSKYVEVMDFVKKNNLDIFLQNKKRIDWVEGVESYDCDATIWFS